MSYCQYAPGNPLHAAYHDHEYGFPLYEDADLFGRLILEINQAGLSWDTILRKKDNFLAAYEGFDPQRIAAYSEVDTERLLNDAGIIRNRRKIAAAISNAQKVLELRAQYGSFAGWLDHHHPLSKEEWVKLFKRTFVFTGGEIVNEFLLSTGYLPGAHEEWCPVYARILALEPPWLKAIGKNEQVGGL